MGGSEFRTAHVAPCRDRLGAVPRRGQGVFRRHSPRGGAARGSAHRDPRASCRRAGASRGGHNRRRSRRDATGRVGGPRGRVPHYDIRAPHRRHMGARPRFPNLRRLPRRPRAPRFQVQRLGREVRRRQGRQDKRGSLRRGRGSRVGSVRGRQRHDSGGRLRRVGRPRHVAHHLVVPALRGPQRLCLRERGGCHAAPKVRRTDISRATIPTAISTRWRACVPTIP